MSHTRFELGFPRHRKVFRLSDAAFRLWGSAIDYAREQRTNGRIDKIDLAAIPRGAGGAAWKTAQADELVKAGLWEQTDGAWQIHDFLDWQDSELEANAKREQARERMRRVRANRKRTSGEVTLTDHDPPSDSDPVLALETGSAPPVATRDLAENARKILLDPFGGSFQQPSKWPEVQAIGAAWSFGSELRLGDSPRSDSDLRAILEAIAAGNPTIDLIRAGSLAIDSDYFAKPERRHPAAFTPAVIRRLLADPAPPKSAPNALTPDQIALREAFPENYQ